MYSLFQAYDDEGFILVSLREYVQGGAIYDEVFGQYGPLYYQLLGNALRLVGILPTHDVGRMITLALWVGSSLVLGYAMYRLTNRLLIGLAVQIGAFLTLFTLVNEPLHPGGLVVVLLVGVVASSTLIVPRWPTVGMAFLGGLVAAIALVKVNVGVFAGISVAFSLSIVMPGLRRRWIRIAASLLFVLSPLALMAGNLDQAWGRGFAFVVAMAAAAVVVTTTRVKPADFVGWRHLAWLGGGIAAVTGAVVLVALAEGTSLGGLVRGVITDPLRQPDIFVVPLNLPNWAPAWAALNLILAVVVRLFGRGKSTGLAQGVARLIGGLVILYAVGGPVLLGVYPIGLALPMTWMVLDLSPPDRLRPAHVLIPSLAVLQTLHAYPVAGSQVAWSVFLLTAVCGTGIASGQAAIEEWLARGRVPTLVRQVLSTLPLVLVATLVFYGAMPRLRFFSEGYANNVPLKLPGARRLRLPADQAEVLRNVTADLEANCSTFISLPGLNSFYVFAEQEPPTGMNQSGWIFVFEEELQDRIVAEVSPTDRLCALRNRTLEDVWLQDRPLPKRPLVRYILDSFRPVSAHGDYEVLVRRTA